MPRLPPVTIAILDGDVMAASALPFGVNGPHLTSSRPATIAYNPNGLYGGVNNEGRSGRAGPVRRGGESRRLPRGRPGQRKERVLAQRDHPPAGGPARRASPQPLDAQRRP